MLDYTKTKTLGSLKNILITAIIDGKETDIKAEMSDYRISSDTLPENKYLYTVQHSEDDDSYPERIMNNAFVNFMSDIITDKPLDIPIEGIEIKDIKYIRNE